MRRTNTSQEKALRRRRADPIENLELESVSPPAVSVYDADAASVDSVSRRFSEPYVPPPRVDRNTVLFAGLFIFVLAMIWPPWVSWILVFLSTHTSEFAQAHSSLRVHRLEACSVLISGERRSYGKPQNTRSLWLWCIHHSNTGTKRTLQTVYSRRWPTRAFSICTQIYQSGRVVLGEQSVSK